MRYYWNGTTTIDEDTNMDEAANTYLQWLLAQQVEGCTITPTDKGVSIEGEQAKGEVNFYDIADSTVVEMRLEHAGNGKPLFFLHFELEDLERAKELFNEMASAIPGASAQTTRHVLLCCSCGITTTFFANKLNECACQAGLPYDFCAMSITEAKREGASYVAVLLAPQVGHQRQEVVRELPDTLVMELPAHVFGSYDAPAALRLVNDAVTGARAAAASDLRMARDFDHAKRVLAVSYVYREDEPTLAYRVLDGGKEALAGMLVRRSFDTHAFDDLEATLRVSGWVPNQFDAVGIAVPGIVDNGVATVQTGSGAVSYDLAGILSKRWGVQVFVDNNATAAAAGCYVKQRDWDFVAFHAQTLGVPQCDEGYVFQGRPIYGRGGYSGSLGQLAEDFSLSMDLADASWRIDGTRELVARYLSVTICTIAPQAIFVWCDLLPDMDDLRDELLKTLPAEAIPELVAVSDYDGHTLMGEMALCLQRLAEQDKD